MHEAIQSNLHTSCLYANRTRARPLATSELIATDESRTYFLPRFVAFLHCFILPQYPSLTTHKTELPTKLLIPTHPMHDHKLPLLPILLLSQYSHKDLTTATFLFPLSRHDASHTKRQQVDWRRPQNSYQARQKASERPDPKARSAIGYPETLHSINFIHQETKHPIFHSRRVKGERYRQRSISQGSTLKSRCQINHR